MLRRLLPFLKIEKVLYFLTLLAVFLFFGYSLYNINSTNRYVDSILKSNYYQGVELNNYLTGRIDNELENIVREKVENDDLYAAISFNKSASRSELWVNLFGAISAVFLIIIGFLVWTSSQHKKKSEEIVEDLERMRKEAIKISESAKESVEEIRKTRMVARQNLITQIRYKNMAERLKINNKE